MQIFGGFFRVSLDKLLNKLSIGPSEMRHDLEAKCDVVYTLPCITGPVYGKSTSYQWIPAQTDNDTEIFCFLCFEMRQ